MAAVALVLAVLAVLGTATDAEPKNPLDPALDWYKPYDAITFYVGSYNYEDFIRTALYKVIARSSSGNLITPLGPRVLQQQNMDAKPFRWLFLTVVGAGDDRTTLAIRQDNLYVTGFTDRDGNWYIFNNRPRQLIPVATVVRIADSYPGLVGGWWNLRGVRAGRQTTMDAVQMVANFAPVEAADVGYVSRTLAILVVTFSEASRFGSIGHFVADSWENSGDLDRLADLVIKWKVVSCALLISVQEGGSWNSKEAEDLRVNTNIRSLGDALVSLRLAVWPGAQTCSKRITWLK